MNLNITLLCDHNINTKPRSSRLLELLGKIQQTSHHTLCLNVISKDCQSLAIVDSIQATLFSFPPDKSSKQRTKQENDRILKLCKKGDFMPLIFTPNRKAIAKILSSLPLQNLLIVEDITLLPFACEYKKHNPQCKILIDLREFYPLEYENDTQWLQGLGRFFSFLCESYLSCVDFAFSVSDGLCERYKKDFHIPCKTFLSLPPFYDVSPRPTQERIKILYHGFISPDRSSMELLDLARLLEQTPFSLHIMALSNQKGFLESFTQQAKSITSLQILQPVAMKEIIPTSLEYDIGLIPFKPTTFNLAHCMPNKLFEYLQARLAILSTPLQDMSHFLNTSQCGIITNGFESSDIVSALTKHTKDDIDKLKHNAHLAAQKWHLDMNLEILKNVLSDVLGIKIE
ncbi:capsular biosynthesis protein [uncultured Helicobacter sp.]|uniref:capsular biosynthesis protein n=1 Tax=uncultured Helicobacter sp. TaxID=175537 RepID=UPI0025DE08BE|nr:capsular biosynthesis protein [uncultured Helicobacter sp.]